MGLFGFLKKDKDNDPAVHPDLEELLWYEDGPKKNYGQKINSRTTSGDGLKITIEVFSTEEPSLLSVKMPVSFDGEAEKPPYYPTYKGLSPRQKGEYWRLLANPYEGSVDIGYVFILYYGLERFLMTDRYGQAADVILRLRDVYSNNSFQRYSANAVVLTSIIYKRPDVLAKFLTSLDKSYEYDMDEDLYLLCKYLFELPLMPGDIIHMARSFEFTKMNYIRKYPEVFRQILIDNIEKTYGDKGLILDRFISRSEFMELPQSHAAVFANVSIDGRYIFVPQILASDKLKNSVNGLLCQTHEDVKDYLAQMRKQGTPVFESEKPVKVKEKKELEFDAARENELLTEYDRQKNDPAAQHLISIQLQDLYYKYRDLDPKYLEKCIYYCEEDISRLSIMQHAYKKQGVAFKEQIPAFYRLAVIYEKTKNYKEAMAICNFAISYYSSLRLDESAREFMERKQKLEKRVRP